MDKQYENIIYEKKEGVATITLNRPKALNALNISLLTEVEDALRDAEADKNVCAIVITGAGDRAFCAGADISMLLDNSAIEMRGLTSQMHGVTRRMERLLKPIVAKVNGFCFGGGNELAMACDFRIVSDKATFGQPEINLAVIPGMGGTQRLPRLIGKTKAMELAMTGESINAAEAYRLNLVNKVVPVAELDKAVDDFVVKLKSKSSVILGTIKQAITEGINMDLESALRFEAGCFAYARATEDATEGLKAFLEKRRPEFKGR